MQNMELLEYLIFYLKAADRVLSSNYEEFAADSLDYIKSLGPKFEETFEHIIEKKADKLILSGKTYEYILSNMAHCKSVDEFILYLKNILAEIIQVKPQLLKSKENERLEFILDFDDIKSLRKALAEKKIESLFYGSFKDVYTFYESRIGFKLVHKQEDFDRINLLIRTRNLLVHNGGRGNTDFKKEFPEYSFGVADEVRYGFSDVLENNRYIIDIVKTIDATITSKFGLSLDNPEDLEKKTDSA